MSLPKGYKRLEYIQSSGTQYVDSGIKGSQNIRVDVDYETTATAGAIIGADTKWGSNMFTIEVHFAAFATSNYHHTTVPSGRHTVSLNKGVFSLDGTVLSTMTGTFTTPVNMTLFALNRNGSLAEYGTLKLYSMQIYDNGLLERDYIPAMLSNGEVGLYDRVFHTFYRNAGTGEFTAGPEMVHEDYTELEYVQSTGAQHIDTLFKPDNNTRVVIDFKSTFSTANSPKGLFGSRNSSDVGMFAFLYSSRIDPNYNGVGKSVTVDTLQRHVYDFNKNVFSVDEFTVSFDSGAFSPGYNAFLLSVHNYGAIDARKAEGYLYASQFYNDNELDRDYIPMLHPSGVAGLWDSVNGRFYVSATTTDFIAGPEAQTVPKAPANFRVEAATDTLVTLAWDPGEDAMGYRLYRQGQLLADITETSVSVAVEPFAGAVFLLTAYNENGEGPGSTLTHYNIPENPLLYLITDRTQQDVTERNPKGYYAASDLNRVGYAMEYLAPIIQGYGYTLEVHTKTDWTDEDWKLTGEMVKYLQSLNNMKAVFSTLVELPETMEKINYVDANNIEQLLLTIDETVACVVAGFTRANAFALRSGAKGLPASQSYRGRNWGELDAMETTWANWQLATWYLLLYGNLKAEGVVE